MPAARCSLAPLLLLAGLASCVRAGFRGEAAADATASDVAKPDAGGDGVPGDLDRPDRSPDALPTPVAHWKLDDGAGTTVKDATGNGHDGTIVGSVSWRGAGALGGALYLDGTDNHVTVPYAAGLTLQRFTVTAWARLETQLKERALVTSAGGPGWNGGWRVATDLSGWHGVIWSSGSSDTYLTCEPPADGTWQHLALTFDGSRARLYRDSVLCQEQVVNVSVHYPNQDPLYIGRGDGLNDFRGEVDDVRVYGLALPLADIVRIFNGES